MKCRDTQNSNNGCKTAGGRIGYRHGSAAARWWRSKSTFNTAGIEKAYRRFLSDIIARCPAGAHPAGRAVESGHSEIFDGRLVVLEHFGAARCKEDRTLYINRFLSIKVKLGEQKTVKL